MAISKETKIKIFNKQSSCVFCGCNQRCYLDLDHIKPKAKGGRDIESNLQVVCGACNKGKGTKTNEEFKRVLEAMNDLVRLGVVNTSLHLHTNFIPYHEQNKVD